MAAHAALAVLTAVFLSAPGPIQPPVAGSTASHSIFVYQLTSDYGPAPYWYFNDPAHGVQGEQLDPSAGAFLAELTAGIFRPTTGGWVRFSDSAPTGPARRRMMSRLVSSSAHGSVYRLAGGQGEAWLCPVLFLYYPTAPARLWVAV